MQTIIYILLPSFMEIGKVEVTKLVRGFMMKKIEKVSFWPLSPVLCPSSDVAENFTGSLFPYSPSLCQVLSRSIQCSERYMRKSLLRSPLLAWSLLHFLQTTRWMTWKPGPTCSHNTWTAATTDAHTNDTQTLLQLLPVVWWRTSSSSSSSSSLAPHSLLTFPLPPFLQHTPAINTIKAVYFWTDICDKTNLQQLHNHKIRLTRRICTLIHTSNRFS